MTSNNIETETYSYTEEEVEIDFPNNAIIIDTNWGEFGNIQMEAESDIQEDEKIKTNKKTVVRKATSSNRRKQNLKAIKSSLETIDPSKIVTVVSTESGNEESDVKNLKSSAALFDGNALFDGTFFTFVGEYYIQSSLNQTLIRKFKGKCELCQYPVYIVGSGSSTFNFLRHLKRKHGQKSYDSYIAYKQVKSPKIRPSRPKGLDLVKKTVTSTTKILGTVNIHVVEGYAWNQFGNPRNKRALNSIILADGISDKILNDVRDFLRSSAWYDKHGVPYRRTFLLHGPSGCGKSSFVFALASELNFGLCVLYASDRELTDSKLNHLLNTAPENSIILLEDIDAVFPTSEERKERSSQLTLSGILNCLDGATAPEGRILFMTCTDKDRLDPSLLRPGRVDVKEYFGFCSQNQIALLFKKFCGGTTSRGMEFTQEVIKLGRNVSPAQLQGFFSFNKHGDVEKLKSDIERIWDF